MTRQTKSTGEMPPITIPAIPPANVLGRLAALQDADTPALKQQWRELFGKEPPPHNRAYLQRRLAYRIQELAYGGSKPETLARLEALGEQLDGGNIVLRRIRGDGKPIAGTRLIREYQGGGAHRDGAAGRLRMAGAPLRVAVRHRARNHRNTLEWLDLLWNQEPAGGRMSRKTQAPVATTPATVRKIRCAVYTRKSTEEGLDKEFNSLDAQRESCEAYITSQRAEGWVLVPDRYDDGGISGGTLERPALQRLLGDIEADWVDVVVVYKIDRLSRSLMHFAKLVETFDAHAVTFVSVTQSFNTTTSMGRLTLNILLSFAQFEREVIGERVRDKIAASRARGMWMGESVPLGYDARDRKLVVNDTEAATVRRVFEGFAGIGSAMRLIRVLRDEGVLTKTGRPFDQGSIYKLLNNRTFVGQVVHKGNVYPGEHQAIVPQDLWDSVHAVLQEKPRVRANQNRRQTPALLRGLIFGSDGRALSPSHTRRRGKLYRYYVRQAVMKGTADGCLVRRLPAGEIEAAVIDQVRALLRQPEVVMGTWRAARADAPDLTESETREALERLDPLWEELFPAEQARIVRLLVERVEISPTGADIRLRVEGLTSLMRDLNPGDVERRRAA